MKLKFQYPTSDLEQLQKDLKKVISDLKMFIDHDSDPYQKERDKQTLEKMEKMLEVITQELNRRAYFHSTW